MVFPDDTITFPYWAKEIGPLSNSPSALQKAVSLSSTFPFASPVFLLPWFFSAYTPILVHNPVLRSNSPLMTTNVPGRAVVL